MTEEDRCPRKHLSHRLGPPTSSDSAHRYGWPPSSIWGVMGRGLLDFRAPPMGVQGGALWVGFVWGHSPSTEPAPMRWSFGGGSGDWKGVSEWRLGDQRASPAMLAFKRRGSACRGYADGSRWPQQAGPPRPSSPKAGRLVCAPGSFHQLLGSPGCFSADPQKEQGVFGPKEASGAGVPERAPASTRKGAAWAWTLRGKGNVTKSQDVWTSRQTPVPPHSFQGHLSQDQGLSPLGPPHSPAPHQLHLPRGRGPPRGSWASAAPPSDHSQLSWGWEASSKTGTLP